MQIFLFGAAKPGRNKRHSIQHPFALEKLIQGERVLDWMLHELESAGISAQQVYFVGGYQVEEIIQAYPQLNYVINPRWEETHVMGSLRYAMRQWNGGPVLLCYADTVFRASIFQRILSHQDGVYAGVDLSFLQRITDQPARKQAEKVRLDQGRLVEVGRSNLDPTLADGQFTGLMYIDRTTAAQLQRLLLEDSVGGLSDQSSLTDLLHLFIDVWKQPVFSIEVNQDWAELDTPADLARFIFGTKAETLARIRPFMQRARICEQIHFDLRSWMESESLWLDQIQSEFAGRDLIIRSSSVEEDSWESSQAGAFLSVAGVHADDRTQLKTAIEQVIQAFREAGTGRFNPNNQVLVQPFVQDVAMSGVAFTRHLESGSPYYIINYDDTSGKTDTITSGNAQESKSIAIYKQASSTLADTRLQQLVDALAELQQVTGHSSLDVEFVHTNAGEWYIVQVRPITLHQSVASDEEFDTLLQQAKAMINHRMQAFSHLYGDTTILADMPDWNPAEMIGIRPTPLALSLYQYLITDSAWRIARAQIGYHHPAHERLLYCIGGHPYIDVRNSFNNLIPAGLSEALSHKLLNHYLGRLAAHPHLHDKVEFEIVITCFTADIDRHLNRLRDDGFSETEIHELAQALHRLTDDAVLGKRASISACLLQTEQLAERVKNWDKVDGHIAGLPHRIQSLLDDCRENGTIPFSIMARYGFIAASLLRGFVAAGILTEERKHAFLHSIETVASSLVKQMNDVLAGKQTRSEFLASFGHLRPGTYDIHSYSYQENPDHYFPDSLAVHRAIDQPTEQDHPSFEFTLHERDALAKELERMQLTCTFEELIDFIRQATAAREYAKFQFTKSVDAILRLLVRWGQSYQIDRAAMGYLFIDDILQLNKTQLGVDWNLYLRERIQFGQQWHERVNRMETPQLIFGASCLDHVEHNTAHPNFVTGKSIVAEIVHLQPETPVEALAGRIVLTEGADPGYDWIFLHPIQGLITKYGGSASHMTIRCAEFGLPAAIGCGEEWFQLLRHAKGKVELNCLQKKIRVLG